MKNRDDKSKYVSLAPRNEKRKEYDEYYKALDFSIEEKTIKNIAVTGSYGSGKSSVLDSYLKNRKNLKYIKISLADFDMKGELEKGGVEIEEDVLKCLFYSIDGKRLKNSRHISISSKLNFTDIIYRIFLMIIIIITLYMLFLIFRHIRINFSSIEQLYNTVYCIFDNIINIVRYRKITSVLSKKTLVIVAIACIMIYICFKQIFIIIEKVAQYFKKISIKIMQGSAEIESDGKSIINKYLHEIINMIISINQDVFIFEDLDRYKNHRIFVKLRKLNTIINNNEIVIKKYKRKNCSFIKFLNQLFTNIIVKNLIFIIDGLIKKVNGKRKLCLLKIEEELYEILNNSIENCNCIKFVYAVKDDLLSYEKENDKSKFFDFVIPIIPMITQNNISDLMCRIIDDYGIKGIDKRFINDVSSYISNIRVVNSIFNEFEIYKGSLKNINEESNDKELLALIIYKNIDAKGFEELQKNDKLYELFKSIKEQRLEQLKKFEQELRNLNTEIYPNISRNSELRKKYLNEIIPELKNNSKLIYTINEINSVIEDSKMHEFITMSIKNKYIDENYYNYINYFYEGQISLRDRRYLKIVNQKCEPDKTYEIEMIKNIYEYLDKEDFAYKSILNYSMVKYAVCDKSSDEKTINLIKTIVNEYGLKEISNVIEYIGNSEKYNKVDIIIRELLKLCFEVDNEIFESIDNEKIIEDNERFKLVNNIILLMLPEQIKTIDKNKKLTKVASANVKLISELDEERQNVYLDNIDFDCSLIKCDYDDKVGILSKKIVKKKIDNKEPVGYYNLLENYFKHEKEENFNNNEFVNNNYDYICDSGDDDLISNIEDNIDSYTENCLLKTGARKIIFTDKILVLLYKLKNKNNVETIVSMMEGEYDITQFNYEIVDEEQKNNIKRRKCIYNSVIKNHNIDLKLESLYKYYKLCGWNDSIVEYVSKKIEYIQENKNLDNQEEKVDFCTDLLMECKNIDGIEMLISNQRISLQAGQFNALSDKTKSYLINHNNLDYSTSLIQPIKLISNKYLVIYLTNNIDEYLKGPLDYDLSVIDIEDMIKLDKMNDEQIFKLIDLRVTGDKVIEHNGKIEKFIISSKRAFNQIIMEKAMNNLSFNNKVAMLLNKIDTIDNTLLMHLLRYNGGLFKEYLINGTQNLYSINTSLIANGKTKKLIEKLKNISVIKVQKLENDDIIFQL